MSYMHDFTVKNLDIKREKTNYIVPERIREACTYRGYTYKEAAERCDINYREFGTYANGHKQMPNDLILKLAGGLRFPKEFFYEIRWGRV